jgi:Fe-S cluster biogenesis protein NfuA/nitrite reductase/ring-hydroxylating ferredoxin subunit
MLQQGDLRTTTDGIERLLQEFREAGDPRVTARAEELVGLLMKFYGAGFERVLEIVTSDGTQEPELLEQLTDDELVSSVLILHGLHPLDLETRVRRALERVRPYLGSHGGDVEIVGFEGDTVRLRMQGTCESCPASAVTLNFAIEKAILEAAPELTGIVAEGIEEAPAPAPATAPSTPLIQLEPLGTSRPAPTNGHAGHSHPASDHGEARADRLAPTASEWHVLEAPAMSAAMIAAVQLGGVPVLVCRSQDDLYAYRDACPACASPFGSGRMDGALLSCPRCERRFDVRLAGRAADGSRFRLDPFPLLTATGSIRIAVPVAHA